MDCACVYIGDYDNPDFCSTKIRSARKEHKCVECSQLIKVGEKYEDIRGKWESGIERYITCLDCVSLREAFFCDGFLYGGMWENFWSFVSDVIEYNFPFSKIAELTPTARSEVCEGIEQIWDEMGL